VEKDFLRCPNCMRKLKDPCPACGKPLDPMWKICPYCEADVEAAPPPTARRTRRRRESGAADAVAPASRSTRAPREVSSERPVSAERPVAAERPVGATGFVDPGSVGPPTR
jgi:hypothetical protein